MGYFLLTLNTVPGGGPGWDAARKTTLVRDGMLKSWADEPGHRVCSSPCLSHRGERRVSQKVEGHGGRTKAHSEAPQADWTRRSPLGSAICGHRKNTVRGCAGGLAAVWNASSAFLPSSTSSASASMTKSWARRPASPATSNS